VSLALRRFPRASANRPAREGTAPDLQAVSHRFDRPDSSCTRSGRRRFVRLDRCGPDRAALSPSQVMPGVPREGLVLRVGRSTTYCERLFEVATRCLVVLRIGLSYG
jgi:hypothetical protein